MMNIYQNCFSIFKKKKDISVMRLKNCIISGGNLVQFLIPALQGFFSHFCDVAEVAIIYKMI